MIIVASQRGGAIKHGKHLLKSENEHVTVHEVSGFMADDVLGACKEDQAIARGTKCKQHLFTASFNAPEGEEVTTEDYINAINLFQNRQGLDGQPRMIVFHEKEGRRHAHATWSRIDRESMTAKQMSHFKRKSQEVSRELFTEHDWKMPEGFAKNGQRNPLNFTLAEWQQAKRMGQSAKDIKASIQEAWAISDSKLSFEQAMNECGYYLAKGDKRGHVALTHEGEVLSIARMIGEKTKDVKVRLGDPKEYSSVNEIKIQIAKDMTPVIERYIHDHQRKSQATLKPLNDKRLAMVQAQKQTRTGQKAVQEARANQEQLIRSNHFRKGLKGIWDRLNGKHRQLKKQNDLDTLQSSERDKHERETLILKQIRERSNLQTEFKQERQKQTRERLTLYRDIERYKRLMPQKNLTQTRNHNRPEIER